MDGDTIDDNTAALVVAWPDTFGVYGDHAAKIAEAKAAGAVVIFVADPLALTITTAPVSLGAVLTKSRCAISSLLAAVPRGWLRQYMALQKGLTFLC